MIFDAIAFITSLALGILGALTLLSMPAAASYVLIGVSGAILLLWIAMLAKRHVL
jgi:hypothetical protein